MPLLRPDSARRARTVRHLLAWLCLLLVVFAGTASLLHMHSGPEALSPTCSLCVVAHVAQAPAPVLSLQVLVALVLLARPPELTPVPARELAFDLSVRPPPATRTHA